jgi:sugar/nucleoside kinase (ribokinase family)
MKVVCVGDCGIDHYLPSGEKRVGGITANVARHARNQFPDSDEIVIVSCLGDDPDAEQVREEFSEGSVKCIWEALSGRTPVQHIEVQADGERHFVRYEPGVLTDFRFSSAQRQAIESSELMVAPVYLQIVGLYAELMAIPTNGLVAIDFADFLEHPDFSLLEDRIDDIDIGFFGLAPQNGAEIERVAKLAADHDKLFIVTLGRLGSVVHYGGHRLECPAVPVEKVVDTTGAGDAFAAAFLSRYCHGATLEQSVQHAALTAAGVVSQQGSYPAYDVPGEV